MFLILGTCQIPKPNPVKSSRSSAQFRGQRGNGFYMDCEGSVADARYSVTSAIYNTRRQTRRMQTYSIIIFPHTVIPRSICKTITRAFAIDVSLMTD